MIENTLCLPSPLLAPYKYIEEIPGNNQNMRYRFLVAFNDLFFHIENKSVLVEIGEIISIFHNSSLLIDDIEDSSLMRRGKPCAHSVYGVPLTINTGNLMYFVALQRATSDLPALWQRLESRTQEETNAVTCKANKILVDEMLNLHHGQGLDIYWRDNLTMIDLPSVEDYLRMAMNKTGGLFRLSVKLLALFSQADFEIDELVPFTDNLGIIYQIRDDYLNLVDQRYSEMKGVNCEDLVEGKLSLPVLHGLGHSSKGSPLHRVLFELKTSQEREMHPELVSEAVEHLRKIGSLEFTYGILQEYVSKAKNFLERTNWRKKMEIDGTESNTECMLLGIVTELGKVPVCT